MGKTLVVVNPAAGGGRGERRAAAAIARLRSAGIEVEVATTKGEGDGARLAREGYEAGHRTFVAAGGDGTSFELLNGIFPRAVGDAARVTLGVLPTGSGNSFLRDVAIGSMEEAIAALVRRHTRPCDVLRLTHKGGLLHFINILGVGFTADVASLVNRRLKGLGALGYVAGVLANVATLRHPTFRMGIDGAPPEPYRCTFFAVCNSKYTGGAMMMAPDADPSDARADLIRVDPMSRVDLVRTFPSIFRGTHVLHPKISAASIERLDIDVDGPVDVMIDGEVRRLCPSSVDVLPAAIDFIAGGDLDSAD